MIGADKNDIGEAGEVAVRASFIQYSLSHPELKCKTAMFGEKWPVIDAWIQFKKEDKIYYFFIQVKGTSLGPQGSDSNKRLEITLEKEDHEKLASIVGPTYLIGVDLSGGPLANAVPTPIGYICTVREKAEHGIYSIPVNEKHKLNTDNITKLFEEVAAFWEATSNQKSIYASNFERK